MKYQWAVKITMEYLDGNGAVEQTQVTVQECSGERDARSRHQGLVDALNDPRHRHPKYQRIAGSELLRRPVGDWESAS